MKYSVLITPTAERELLAAFMYIYAEAPLNAGGWLMGIYDKINTLERFPLRCPIAPDSKYLGEELRHLLFKSHRIIFRVEKVEKIVRILGIRHGAQRFIGEPSDTEEEEA